MEKDEQYAYFLLGGGLVLLLLGTLIAIASGLNLFGMDAAAYANGLGGAAVMAIIMGAIELTSGSKKEETTTT